LRMAACSVAVGFSDLLLAQEFTSFTIYRIACQRLSHKSNKGCVTSVVMA
jgi:hypothetical protein